MTTATEQTETKATATTPAHEETHEEYLVRKVLDDAWDAAWERREAIRRAQRQAVTARDMADGMAYSDGSPTPKALARDRAEGKIIEED